VLSARESARGAWAMDITSSKFLLRFLWLLAAMAVLASPMLGQDSQSSPSLGDVARQARQQKQQKDSPSGQTANSQSKDSASNGAAGSTAQSSAAASASSNAAALKPAKHVITNEELPEHTGLANPVPASTGTPAANGDQSNHDEKASAEQWRSQILALKNNIAQMEKSIGDLSASIQYAGANCVANCAQWNEHQKQKQDQVDTMKSQLEQQQKALEDMQDAARRQGYGTSVYDP
jgi:hypothetical protein